MRPDTRSFGEQAADDFYCGSKPDVVGVCLERQPEDSDLFVLDHPQRAARLLEEVIDPPPVELFGFFQQAEIRSRPFRQPNKSLDVFGQAEAAEAQPRA